MYPLPTIFALCMLRLCSILRSADSFPFSFSHFDKRTLKQRILEEVAQLLTHPGQGANAIGVEKEQIDDARGGRGFFKARLPCARGKEWLPHGCRFHQVSLV